MDTVELLFDPDKLKNIQLFVRRGGTRRQDHGEWSNSPRGKSRYYNERRFYYGKGDIVRFARRRVFRRVGTFESEM